MWEIIWYDVDYKMKLKLNELTNNHLQIYYTLGEIASAIFGSKKSDKPEPIKINDLSPEAAVDTMNKIFQMAGAGQ